MMPSSITPPLKISIRDLMYTPGVLFCKNSGIFYSHQVGGSAYQQETSEGVIYPFRMKISNALREAYKLEDENDYHEIISKFLKESCHKDTPLSKIFKPFTKKELIKWNMSVHEAWVPLTIKDDSVLGLSSYGVPEVSSQLVILVYRNSV